MDRWSEYYSKEGVLEGELRAMRDAGPSGTEESDRRTLVDIVSPLLNAILGVEREWPQYQCERFFEELLKRYCPLKNRQHLRAVSGIEKEYRGIETPDDRRQTFFDQNKETGLFRATKPESLERTERNILDGIARDMREDYPSGKQLDKQPNKLQSFVLDLFPSAYEGVRKPENKPELEPGPGAESPLGAGQVSTTAPVPEPKPTSKKQLRPIIVGATVFFLVVLFFVLRNQSANAPSGIPAGEDETSTLSSADGNDEKKQQGDSDEDTNTTSDLPVGANITYDLTYADGDGEGEHWGDSDGGRQAYTKKEINSGVLGDGIVFNSITDGEYGDERNFVGAALITDEETIWYGDSIEVEDGKTYVICLYVRNDNPDGLNAVAENVRVRFSLPVTVSKSNTITGYIDSSNAEPSRYWDSVTLYSNEEFYIKYEEGSVQYINSGMGSIPLTDDSIVKDGAPLGYDRFDGKLPGGHGYDGIVTLKVTVCAGLTTYLSTSARLKSTTKWEEAVFANIGDEVEFQIEYRNLSDQVANNVMIRDILPTNMEYIEGSTYLYTSEYQDGVRVKAETVTTDGINIGSNYQPRANAYVRFSAKIADNALINGTTQLVNWANATVDGEVVKDDVSIMVTK